LFTSWKGWAIPFLQLKRTNCPVTYNFNFNIPHSAFTGLSRCNCTEKCTFFYTKKWLWRGGRAPLFKN